MGTATFPNRILITGPKHSGKTSVGKILAEILRSRFVDLDDLIGKSPREIYREGLDRFREAEAGALASLLSGAAGSGGTADKTISGQPPLVIAAGGGLIDNARAMALLEGPGQTGTLIVYLDVSAETAWERIRLAAEKTGDLPPFLNTANPRETHAALHKRRTEAYRVRAAIIIDGNGKSPREQGREIAEQVLGGLKTGYSQKSALP
jgi:shikimate kinase